MLKKTVTYRDYNGVNQTEDFYFNLTKIECMELEFGYDKGSTLTSSIQTLLDSNDMGTVIATIKKIVLTAYGIKSPDGKRFIKSDEIREAFEQSPAFEEIYWELITNAEKAADFISGIVPSAVRDSLGEDPKQEILNRMRILEASKNNGIDAV